MRKSFLLVVASFISLPSAAQAAECSEKSNGFISANSSQLYDDGFRPGGDNPTIKAGLNIPLADCFQVETFVNKEIGGTKSDEFDLGASYQLNIDEHTSVRLYGGYYLMRRLPDIVETSISITRDRFNISAIHYVQIHAPDGYRLTASYDVRISDKFSVGIGGIHEGGLGLDRDINALLVSPTLDLGNNFSFTGKVFIPTHGKVRATGAIQYSF